MVKKARAIQKAPKVGKVSRLQAKKAVIEVTAKGRPRSNDAARKKAVKFAMAEFKKSVSVAMRKCLSASLI